MRITLTCCVVILILCGDLFAQANVERFERQLEQYRRETDARALPNVPPEQRTLIDYGGFLSFNYFTIDDSLNDNHILRQWDVVGYARLTLDGNELYLRGRTGYRDFNDQDSFDGLGDEIIDPDLDRGFYRFDLNAWQQARGQARSNYNLIAEGGRDLVYWGNGLAMSQVIDGAILAFSRGDNQLDVIAGVTPVRTVDIDFNRPNFDHNTRRGFYGAMLSRQIAQHRPYLYGLLQRDYNEDDTSLTGGVVTEYDYNSYYLGLGVNGAITDRLLYGVEVTYEGGDTLSNSFIVAGPTLVQIDQTRDDIQALGGDVRLDYLMLDVRKTRLSAEFIAASGDSDRFSSTSSTFGGNRPDTSDRAFNAFGLLNTGLSFAPQVSNLLALRMGAVTFPMPDNSHLDRLQLGADLFLFAKTATNAPIEEPTTNDRYLGWEPDVFLNWQISSDVTLALRYGIFFPGTAIISDENRQFFGAGITYAF
jgi:hypothetical protein